MKRLRYLLFLLAVSLSLPGVQTAAAQGISSAPLVPVARNDTAFTFVNTAVDILVLANDEETNTGFEIVLKRIVRAPLHGAAEIDRNRTPADGSDDFIRYTPAAGFVGRDSLRYEIENTVGVVQQAEVYIFVNRAPVAVRDTFVVRPGTATPLTVLANDTDADGDALVITGIPAAPRQGTAVITAQAGVPRIITYTPTAGFVGRDSLRYAISDGKNGRDTTWANLIVDTPPVARDDSATTRPGTAVDVDVLANDTDADGHALTIQSISRAPANGTAAIMAGRVRYTPAAGFAGTDSLRYRAADPLGVTAEATVSLVVNTPPVAVNDTVSTVFETAIDVDVLANDTDADDDVLTIAAIVTPPSHGTAAIMAGRVRYTPDAGYFGADTFVYRAADGQGGTAQATVTVTVTADASVQLIHNAPGVGRVDIYADDVRVADDLDYREATPYLAVPAGETEVDVTAGSAADNSNPLFTASVTLDPLEAYVAVANGVVGENFSLVIKDDARLTATDPNRAEFFIIHGAPDVGQIDIRRLDPNDSNRPSDTLGDNLRFGDLRDYQPIDPIDQNLDVTNFDNTMAFDAYQFDLSGLRGETFVLVASGRVSDGSFTLIAFDAAGNTLIPDIVTAAEGGAELPTAFALYGNHPNPFNPETTIRFDLPEVAEVRVEVVDVLGRRVLALPAQRVEAGAGRSLRLDASRLASGTYLYRVIAVTAAETMVGTGRMMLVK